MATNASKPIRAAIFSDIRGADDAVHKLIGAGFTKDQVTVITSDETKERYFKDLHHQDPSGTHAPTAAATGGAIGATLGGLTAAVGIAATGGAALAVAGAFTAMWGMAVAGGLIGALMTRGFEKEVADFYDQAVSEGRILVAVEDHSSRSAEMLQQAERIFQECGADSVPLSEG